jgi:hypothetical protein
MSKASTIAKRLKADVEELDHILGTSDVTPKEPSAQTKATARYQEKVGLAARTYKLKTADADAFKVACEANGESQAAVLTRLMASYVLNEPTHHPCWFCRLKARFSKR